MLPTGSGPSSGMRKNPPPLPLGDGTDDLPFIDLNDEEIIEDPVAGFTIVVGAPIREEDAFLGRRAELDLVIGAYAEDQPSPAEAMQGLEVAASNALIDLGHEMCPERVRAVSSEHLLRFAAQLPHAKDALCRLEAAAAQMLLGQLATTAGELASEALGPRLAEVLGDDACTELAGIIAKRVTLPLMARPKTFLAEHLGERLWRSYGDVLRLHIGFTLAGCEREARLVAPFAEMFRHGNFPAGMLNDGTFLIVTV